MTGPVAAARPLLRPGSTNFLPKQLSGPAISTRPLRSLTPLSSSSSFSKLYSTTRGHHHNLSSLPICPQHRIQGRIRLYSIQLPPKPPGSNSNSNESTSPTPSHQQEKDDSLSEHATQSSSTALDSPESFTGDQNPENTAQSDLQTGSEPSHFESRSAPELPSQTDSRRSNLSHNFTHLMDTFQSRVLVASQTLNDLTGYSAIEAIKHQNAQLETDLATAQTRLRDARAHYKAVNTQRATTQREVTTLLARKDTWSPLDLERFTTLYRQDHELEAAVAEAGAQLTEAEAEEARLGQALNSGILRRYHEEQIWSDRIRRQSTWGTWGLMGVNVLLFLVLQFVAEPWKRNRLMKGIAAEEKAALEAVQRELEEVKNVLAKRGEAEEAAALERVVDEEIAASAVASEIPEVALMVEEPVTREKVSWGQVRQFLADPSRWRSAMEDLCSERKIDLRMRDASLIALEGAVAGAAVVASVALVLIRRN